MQHASNTATALVTGTDFVTQPVSDYDEAAKFYGETLGLEFSKRWVNMPAGESETGSLTIALIEPDAFGMESTPSTSSISLHLEDDEPAPPKHEEQCDKFKAE